MSDAYTKFDSSQMEVLRAGRMEGCEHLKISTNGFGTKGVCMYCGALIAAKDLQPSHDGSNKS